MTAPHEEPWTNWFTSDSYRQRMNRVNMTREDPHYEYFISNEGRDHFINRNDLRRMALRSDQLHHVMMHYYRDQNARYQRRHELDIENYRHLMNTLYRMEANWRRLHDDYRFLYAIIVEIFMLHPEIADAYNDTIHFPNLEDDFVDMEDEIIRGRIREFRQP